MRNQNRLGTLHVSVAGHHRIAGGASLLDQCIGPHDERIKSERNLLAHIEAQVGGNLLVAAAPGMQLEAKRADALDQLEFDKMMNVFGRRMIAHQRLAGFRCVLGGNCIERLAELRSFTLCENVCGNQGRRVRLASCDFFIEKPPVKTNRTLPGFRTPHPAARENGRTTSFRIVVRSTLI